MAERSLRPRPPAQYISQQEWQLGVQDEDDFILGRRYDMLEKFHSKDYQVDHGFVNEMNGEDFNMKYVQEKGLTQPMVFRNPSGLGMRMPSTELTVAGIKKLVGSRRKVDVMDTLTQDSSTMSLGQWSKYYETFPRKRILNIISLEFSCTKLDPMVEAPQLVRQLDWVEQVWPEELKNMQTNPTNDLNKMMYPKVQKYCLMSVSGCYTDFHIDFGGTSVWYHVLKGEKQFLLIPPSSESYAIFQHWQLSGEQEGIFLADLVGKAQLVHLHAGDTFIMPSGWIHAVYTPSDSIVFGGNFLHSFNIAQQLKVADMEKEIKVPSRLKYPFYGTMHWYVLMKYAKELKELMKSNSKDGAREVSPIGQRWLKEVSVERLMVEDGAAKAPQNVSQNSGQQCRQSDVYLSCNNQEQDATINSIATSKPHLSSHERGGLLLLVHKMKNKLFHLEYPSSLSSPENLITNIEELLQCALPLDVCSMEPSGVGIVMKKRSTTDSKLRARKRDADSAVAPPCKKLGQDQRLSSDHEQDLAEFKSTDITSLKDSDPATQSLSSVDQSDSQRTISSLLQGCGEQQLACKEYSPQSGDNKLQLSHSPNSACKELQLACEKKVSNEAQPEGSSITTNSHPPSDQHSSSTENSSTLPSPLLILLSPGLPPTLISAASLSSLTLSTTSETSQLFVPKTTKTSLTQPPTLSDQKKASSLSSSHSAFEQVMSASSPVSLTQGFEEVTITQVPNPAFTE